MSTVLEHPAIELAETDRHAFNLAVWERLLDDPFLASLDYRIETDRHGQIVMSPPPAPSHGNKQIEIGYLLRKLLPGGKVISECPVSTRDGVKAVDVVWCSPEKWRSLDDRACFLECPEICVEVRSPSNTRSELEEKKRLYFEEGAEEVWFCETNGTMRFFHGPEEAARERSAKVPEFPGTIA